MFYFTDLLEVETSVITFSDTKIDSVATLIQNLISLYSEYRLKAVGASHTKTRLGNNELKVCM